MNKSISCMTALAVTLFAVLISPPAGAEKLKVVASFFIIGDFARHVGGERIALRTLVGANGDAHVYEAKPADAIAMAKADVILVNGLQFEGFLTRLIDASETSAPIIETSKGAHIIRDPAGGHYHYYNGKAVFHAAPFDPHAWQSVANAGVYVENIADAFCDADQAGCDVYRANAAAYRARLAQLDSAIRQAVTRIPQQKRTVVVGHNAFRYFEQAYGLHFLSPQSVSTESEASAADVAGVVRAIKHRRASAVFAENISNPRLVGQIAAEAGLNVAGVLYSDALSEANGAAASYIDMMTRNIQTITDAVTDR